MGSEYGCQLLTIDVIIREASSGRRAIAAEMELAVEVEAGAEIVLLLLLEEAADELAETLVNANPIDGTLGGAGAWMRLWPLLYLRRHRYWLQLLYWMMQV